MCGKKPGELWSNHPNEVSQHRDENQAPVEGEDKTRASRNPNAVPQSVEVRKLGVGLLWERSQVIVLPGDRSK